MGLFANFEVMPRLNIGGRLDYMSLKGGDYDGRLLNTEVKVSYRIFRNFGIGVAYRLVNQRVKAEKTRFEGRFQYRYRGPSAFVQVGF